MIYDTWKGLANLKDMVNEQQITNNSESSDESSSDSDTSSDEDVNTTKLFSLKKQFVNNNIIAPKPVQNPTIKIGGQEYFIDGFNVYIKNPDNTRGELYGAYPNGVPIANESATALRCKIKKSNLYKPREVEIDL